MMSEGFLVGVANAAAVMAGFAGVVGAFRPGGLPVPRVEWLKLRTLVHSALAVLYLSLVPVVLDYLLPDQALTLRLASLLGAVYFGRRVVVHWHLNGGLRGGDATLQWVLMAAALRGGLLLINTLLGSLGLYALVLLIGLFNTGLLFYEFVLHLSSAGSGEAAVEPGVAPHAGEPWLRSMRECPACLHRVPRSARRCGHCSAKLTTSRLYSPVRRRPHAPPPRVPR